MSCIHYKFKSNNDFKTLTFDGVSISVTDLRKEVIQKSNMGKLMDDFQLQITNPQTGQEYKDDDLIAKNTSVILARIPKKNPSKARPMNRVAAGGHMAYKAASDGTSADHLRKSSDLVAMNASEDDKIKAMMEQSTKDYDQTNYMKSRHQFGPPPRAYVCYRCNQPGHFISSCPLPKSDDASMPMPKHLPLKRSTGIPNSMMTIIGADDLNQPGVMMTGSGHYAVPTIDAMAYKQGKKEKPPFVKVQSPERPKEEDDKKIPSELLCLLCNNLLSDAVVIPCCGNSYCDECIRNVLLESDEHKCPSCGSVDQSPDGLIPNKYLRAHVTSFINDTSYISTKKPTAAAATPAAAPVAAAVPSSSIHYSNSIKSEAVEMPGDTRKQVALPSHLIGMPPQVIRAAMDAAAERGTTIESFSAGTSLPSYSTRSSNDFVFTTSSSGGYIPRHQSNMRQQTSGATFMQTYTSGIYSNSSPTRRMAAPQMYQPPSNNSSALNSAVGQSQSAPSLVGSQHITDSQGGGAPIPIHKVIYVDQNGKVLGQQVTTMRPAMGNTATHRPASDGSNKGASFLPDTSVPPPMDPQYLPPPPPGLEPRLYNGPPVSMAHCVHPPLHLPPPPGMLMAPRPHAMQPMPAAVAAAMHQRLTAPRGNIANAPPTMYRQPPPLPGTVPPRMMSGDMMLPPPAAAPAFPPVAAGPLHPAQRPNVPLTEEEFYREQLRLRRLKMEPQDEQQRLSRLKMDPLDEFAQELKERAKKKPIVTRPRSKPRSRSPSPIKRRSPSPVRRRSRSLSPLSPPKRRSPSPRPLPTAARRGSVSPPPAARRQPQSPRRSLSPLSPVGRRSLSPRSPRRNTNIASPLPRRSISPGPRRSLSPLSRRSTSPRRVFTPPRSVSPRASLKRRSPTPRSPIPIPSRRTAVSPRRSYTPKRWTPPPASQRQISRSPSRSPARRPPSRGRSPARRTPPPRRRSPIPVRSPSRGLSPRLRKLSPAPRRSVSRGFSPRQRRQSPARLATSRSRSRSVRRKSFSRSPLPVLRRSSSRGRRTPRRSGSPAPKPLRSLSRSLSPGPRKRQMSPLRDVRRRSPSPFGPSKRMRRDSPLSPYRRRERSPLGPPRRNYPMPPSFEGPGGAMPQFGGMQPPPRFGEFDAYHRGNSMDPNWAEYMRFVSEFYDRLGYPGYNPFISNTSRIPGARPPSPPRYKSRSRSPRLPPARRSRSGSRDSGHRRPSKPYEQKRSRSHERRDASKAKNTTSSRSREREAKEIRKLSSREHTSKLSNKQDPKHLKSSKTEKGKSKTVSSSKDQHSSKSKADDKSEKVSKPKSRPDVALEEVKQTKSAEERKRKPSIGDKAKETRERKLSKGDESRKAASVAVAAEVRKSEEHFPVTSQNKITSLLDLKFSAPNKGLQAAEKVSNGSGKTASEEKPKVTHVKKLTTVAASKLKAKSENLKKEQKKAARTESTEVPMEIPLEREKQLADELAASEAGKVTSTTGKESEQTQDLTPQDETAKSANGAVGAPESLPVEPPRKKEADKPKLARLRLLPSEPLTEDAKPELPKKKPVVPDVPVLVASIPEKSRWERDSGSDDEMRHRSITKGQRVKASMDKNAIIAKLVVPGSEETGRSKPQQSSVVAIPSVVRSPPPKSSVQLMTSQLSQPGSESTDTRKVVQTGKEKPEKTHRSEHKHRRPSSDRKEAAEQDKPRASAAEITETKLAATGKMEPPAAPAPSRKRFEDRKVSVTDEDQFEPDYDETETTMEPEHGKHILSRRKSSTDENMDADDKKKKKKSKHHSGKRSHRSSSGHDDSGVKSKKHKKHKKSKHKSKKDKDVKEEEVVS